MLSILVIILLILFSWLAWRDIPLSLGIIVAFAPVYLVRFGFYGLPVTLLELMILTVFLVWAAFKEKTLKLESFWWPILVFLAAASLSLLFSPDLRAGLGIWRAYFFEPIIFFTIFIDQIKTYQQVKKIFLLLSISIFLISLLAIFQYFSLWQLPYPWYLIENHRAISIFEYPNALALFLAPYLSLLVLYLWKSPGKLSKQEHYLILISIITGGIGLFLSKSLAGMASVTAVLTILARPRALFGRSKLYLGLLTLLLLALTIGLASSLNFFPAKLNSGSIRLQVWQNTLNIIKDHPLKGTGLAGFAPIYSQYIRPGLTEVFVYPHNIVLNFWLETGFLGLLAFIWLIIRVVRSKQAKSSWLFIPAVGGLVTLLVHGLVDVPYFKNDLAIQFWFLYGLAIVSHKITS